MHRIELKKDKIYKLLKQDIISSKLPAGKKLPRETDFAESLNVGRITLRAALDRLEHEGYVNRIHGKGTFVSPDSGKSAKTQSIMVVRGAGNGFEAPHNYIVPEVIRLEENRGCRVLTTTDTALLMFSSADIKSYVEENNVAGIIAVINNFLGHEPIIKKFRNAGVPVVIAHCSIKDTEITGFAGIAVNEREAWETAIAYLAECGHKNIGILGHGNHNFRGFTKQECMELLEKYNVNSVESWIKLVEFDRDFIKAVIREIFDGDAKPSAILCYSDFSAIYVYEALKEMNLKIPEDVAVMGTCGNPDAELLTPPLSTVDYEYSRFAHMAVEMLQEPEKWFTDGKGKLREKSFKIRKRESTDIEL